MKENTVVNKKRYYGGRPDRERWEMMADFITDLKNTKIYPEEIEYLRNHFYSTKYYFKGKAIKVMGIQGLLLLELMALRMQL